MNNQFVNLHNHTWASLQDSISSPDDIAKKTKELGMNAVSVTDHGTLSAHFQFKQACQKHNIKPIFGVEAYFTDDVTEVHKVIESIDEIKDRLKVIKKDKRFKKETAEKEELLEELQARRDKLKKYNHLILLAQNSHGYENLVKIHNDAIIDGIYYKPRIDWKVLEKHKGGLIASSACLGGRLSKLIEANDFDGAINAAYRFESIFGKGNFYLELQLNDIKLQKDVNIALIKIHETTGLPISISCDAHYIEKSGAQTRQLIRQLDKEPDEINNDDMLTDLYLKNDEMLMASWKKYMPEVSVDYLKIAIENTRKISDSIENFPFDVSLKFPDFETGNLTQEEFLVKEAWKGLERRKLSHLPEYVKRLQFELDTVNKLGFAKYFNVVSDMLNYSKCHQATGPGRGCVVAGTPVFMGNNTIKNIEDIRVLDTVVSHDGTIQPVTNIHRYEVNEELLEIETWNTNPITLTKDHKVYAYSYDDPSQKSPSKDKFKWIETRELKAGDFVWIPKIQRLDIEENNSFDLLLPNGTFQKINADEEFVYWLGKFSRFGWISEKNRNETGISFDERDVLNVENYTRFLYKYNLRFTITKIPLLTQIVVNDKGWKELLEGIFVNHIQEKHVPKFLFGVNDSLIVEFLKGYSDSPENIHSQEVKYESVSQEFLNDIQYLHKILGLPTKKTRITSDYRNAYSEIEAPNPHKLQNIVLGKAFDSGTAIRIKNINKVNNVKFVYDITTNKNHSYLSNFSIHNSSAGSLLSYVVGITEVDPIRYSLFFERFLDSSKGIMKPSFGLSISQLELDTNKILGDCACNKKH